MLHLSQLIMDLMLYPGSMLRDTYQTQPVVNVTDRWRRYDNMLKDKMLQMDPQQLFLNLLHRLGTSTFSEKCEEFLLFMLSS